ncbi:MAG: BatA domain-containing protein [bacterium]
MFGLTYLNSLFLWGLVATSIPIIIHLIKRNRAVKLPFAAMRFLQIHPNQKVKSQKFKQLLLLLMRILALALLALAFARPYFANTDPDSIWSRQPKAAVILIDNSYSMDYGEKFQEAIKNARKVLASFNPGDKVAIMSFAESAKIISEMTSNYALTQNEIESKIPLTNFGTHYLIAIESAETYLLDTGFNLKEMYLISDFQKSGLPTLYSNIGVVPDIRLHFMDVAPENHTNLAIKEVHISATRKSSKNKNALVRIKNYGGKKRQATVLLHINQRKVAQRKVSLAADEEKIVQFSNVRIPKGQVTGHVEIRAQKDGLWQDNHHYFVIEKQNQAQILAVDGEPDRRDVIKDELFYLDRALNLPKLSKFKLTNTTPEQLHNVDFNDYQTVILANVKDMGRTILEQLHYYVRNGGGLLIALGDRVNPTIYNRLFQELSPATINNLAFDSVNRENSVILAETDYQHPIFKIFSDASQGDPGTAQFYQYYYTQPYAASSVLASYDDGGPAVLERHVGDGKVVLFTSSLDAEWNNLPVKAIFLPILYQTLQHIAPQEKGQRSYLVGQPVALHNFASTANNQVHFEVAKPDGEKVDLKEVLFKNTATLGIYRILRKGRKRALAAFAVNIDPTEADLTQLNLAELQSQITSEADPEPQTAALSSPLQEIEKERHQKLWRLALLAVVLLLIGETWLANRTYR